jgi:hypothetical protein
MNQLLDIKTFDCCGKRYTWLPSKDTILEDDEEPHQKAWLVHQCNARAIWNYKTRMYFKKLKADSVPVTQLLSG